MNDKPKLTAYLVRVTRIDPTVAGDKLSMLYAVLTETPEKALAIVADSVPADADVDLTDDTLPPETVKRIGLRPNYAHSL